MRSRLPLAFAFSLASLTASLTAGLGAVGCSEPAVLNPDDEDADVAVVPAGRADDDGEPAPPVCQALPPADDLLEVQTRTATVKGFVGDDDTAIWKGIRYAKAPVGDLRFRPAALPDCEPAVVDAREDPSQCPQLGADFDVVDGDEDCLFLNVFRPERRQGEDRALLPVLFWIHGGGEILGSGNQPAGVGNLYDAVKLANESQSVVVSINYRLGALGFLAHPALATEGADGSRVVGNWAHTDIIKALEWTRDNIAGFGGDPDHVAIFGESAGAHNVCVMVASPKARGLFSAAIMESGGCEVAPRDVREQEGKDTAADLGCDAEHGSVTDADVATCLRGQSPESFLHLVPPVPPLLHVWWLPYGSTVDGDVLTDQPLRVIERGEHNRVPFIAGSNKEETNLFLAADGALTCIDLRLQLELMLGSSFSDDETGRDERDLLLDEAMDLYACGDDPIVRNTLIAASTDLEFTCQARRVARAMSSSQDQPVWRYHFRDRANFGAFLPMGAFHAWELFYVFDAFETGLYLPSDGERELSHLMQRMWGRMARQGNPNGLANDGSDDVLWPAYVAGVDDVLAFDEDPFAALGGALDVGMVDDPATQCDLWDRYGL